MTDDTTQTPVATTTDDVRAGGQSGAQQDPLSVLESILQDAKKKSGQGAAGAGAGVGAASPQAGGADLDDNRELSPEEKQALLAQREEEAAAAETLRQQQVVEQKAKILEELPQTPQYQVRKQQEEEQQQEQQANVADDGLTIHQLTRTKI